MYMGEIGHNTYQWMTTFSKTMQDNNIGYTYWPYKKLGTSSWVGFAAPEAWDKVIEFAESNRQGYAEIRNAREHAGGIEVLQGAIEALCEAVRFENCTIDKAYIEALGLHVD